MSWREITSKHADGRAVHAIILGEPRCGRVVVYHHGFPASGFEALVARKYTSDFGICIVAIDRPGLGGSDWYSNRTLADWSQDVALVMDAIGVTDFAVMAVSGGTPSAVALTTGLPHRVKSLTIVSGVAPWGLEGATEGANFANRAIMKMARKRPNLAKTTVRTLAHLWRSVPWMVELWFGVLLPKQDKEIVSNKFVGGTLAKSISQAFEQGIDGVVKEFELLAAPWEGELEKVKVPVHIWHGTEDTYVPFSMGRILHERIVGSTFHEIPQGGHFMVIPLIREILAEIVSSTWSNRDIGAA